MKKSVFLIVCLFAAGCQSAPVAPHVYEDLMQKRFLTTSQLHTGLNRTEVAGLLGKEVVIGFSLTDDAIEQYKPITLANPYRSETIKRNNKIYLVDYYVIGIKIADDKISDDELLPLVFEDDRLKGIGWDFFNKHVKGQ